MISVLLGHPCPQRIFAKAGITKDGGRLKSGTASAELVKFGKIKLVISIMKFPMKLLVRASEVAVPGMLTFSAASAQG